MLQRREGEAAYRGPPRGAPDRRAGVETGHTAARLCFGGVVVWWLAQGWLLGTGVGEPYPSVAMPRFARTTGYHAGSVHLERMEAAFVGARGETVVSPRKLLETVTDSHHGAVVKLLAPAPLETSATREWLRRHGMHGLRAPGVVAEPCVDPSLQRWLRRRAAAVGHAGAVTRVEFRWYRHTVHRSSPELARRQPAGVVRVPLQPEAACAA